MNSNKIFDPKKSLSLLEIQDKLLFLINLYKNNKFPKVLMMSGKKGVGKFTIINHFLTYVFDTKDYDLENCTINDQTNFYNQNFNNTFPNIVYLPGASFKSIKIEDIRNLKSNLLKTTLSENKRFIILDDVELFNINSLNALLKTIEEPTANNYFILINNKSKPLMETIYSRSLEIKMLIKNNSRLNIINSLIKKNKLEVFLDYEASDITPGSFLLFNNVCKDNNIDINKNFSNNFELILNLYKKNKSSNLINLILFITDNYFNKLITDKKYNMDILLEKKSYIIKNINKFISFNLNQNSLINAINNKLSNG